VAFTFSLLARIRTLLEMETMKPRSALLGLLPLLALASCSGPKPVLDVHAFHMRDVSIDDKQEPMLLGEKRHHLYGAVEVREMSARLGQYFTAEWDIPSKSGLPAPDRIDFEYLQAKTTSQVRKLSQKVAGQGLSGKAEFRITGDNYLQGGKVLAWRCRMFSQGKEIASRHSYLWE
jgi:hypothetical protein